MDKSAVGRYGWNNFGNIEEVYDKFVHSYLDSFFNKKISGYTLNIGCGVDTRGDVRLDMERTKGTNMVADARFLPFKNFSFDTVICIGVLHHIENYQLAIKEAARVSNKLIIGREPNIFHPHLCLIRYYLGFGGERPLYIPKIKRLYQKEGFHLVKEEWRYGFKFLGSLTKCHSLLIKFDKIIPPFLRGSWSYIYEKNECNKF